MKKIIILAVLCLPILILQAKTIEAPQRSVSEYSSIEMIEYYAEMYGANEQELLVVAKCESNYRTQVYGDGGRAFSVYQFHKPTFDRWAIQLGEDLDYYSYQDQIKLASWAFSKGENYKDDWTCWTSNYDI